MILNNFKEAKITPNEDGTLKFEFYGVQLQDSKRTDLQSATVTYPRIKINLTTFDMVSTNKQFNIEICPDNDNEKTLYSIYVPEDDEV